MNAQFRENQSPTESTCDDKILATDGAILVSLLYKLRIISRIIKFKMNSNQKNICPFEDIQPPMKKQRSFKVKSSSSIQNSNETSKDERRKSLTITSIGRYLSKKLTKRATSGKNVKMIRIQSTQYRDLRRNNSIRSVDFWEEDWATMKRRRSSLSKPLNTVKRTVVEE